MMFSKPAIIVDRVVNARIAVVVNFLPIFFITCF